MSKKSNNEIPLSKIVAPSLTDVGFASGLNEVFENINRNFITLSNRDFVKGETGESLNIKTVYFFDESGNLNDYGKNLKKCIESISTDSDRMSIYDNYSNEISLWDTFNENPGHIQMMFGVNTDVANAIETPISSFYYIFLDGRFATNKLQYINQDQYADIKDLSCVVIYDAAEGGFKALTDAFPTVYFQTNVGLCWKINGVNTGLPVQGRQGKPGLNSPIYIVQCNNLELKDSLLSGKIDAIFDNFEGYRSVNTNDIHELEHLVDSTCLILTQDTNDNTNGNKFYFGTIGLKENILHAYCNHHTAINDSIRAEDFNNVMKNIGLTEGTSINSMIKGLFVPITKENLDKTQSVHLLASTAIPNDTDKHNNRKNDVIFSPINDINTDSNNGDLCIDRYLYIKVNTDSNLFSEESINSDIKQIVKDNSESLLKNRNYILKYKLVNIVTQLNYSDNNEIVVNPAFDVYDYKDLSNIGSRFYLKSGIYTVNGKNIVLSDNNVSYYNSISNKHSLYHWSTMPYEFKNRLQSIDNTNNIGIYRWELCNIKHDWDVEDLLALNTNKYLLDDAFSKVFNTIYTTNANPNKHSNFMWFNGICLDKTHNNGYYENDEKYIIPGWNYELFDAAFDFVKYVAIVNNDFNVYFNNTLNINYDVNILGDTHNPNKNLFVNGIVTCNSIECKSLMDIIDGLRQQIDNLQSQIDELNNNNDSKEQTINELIQQISNLQSQIDELKNNNNPDPEPENPETI